MDKNQFFIEFPPSINGFSQSEYLAIFWGLLFAFVVAEYVISCGKLIKHYQRVIPYWEFIFWILILLMDFIFSWYFNWLRMDYINKNFITFILLLLPSIAYFLIVVVFFPDFSNKGAIDLKGHFNTIMRPFFLLFSLYLFIGVLIDLVLPVKGSMYSVFAYVGFMIITLVLAVKPYKWLRIALLIVYCLLSLLTIPFI